MKGNETFSAAYTASKYVSNDVESSVPDVNRPLVTETKAT